MLKDKIALVTGGGTGIGKAIAVKLAKNGAKVAIASRNRDQLERVAAELVQVGLTVVPVPLNVRVKTDVHRAGISGLSLMSDSDDSKWYDIVDTNLNGMYLLTKATLRHMPYQAGGRIINISSVLGKFGAPGYTAYCTTKHGMIGFTRALALEVVSRGITVNTICPGWVDTCSSTRPPSFKASHQRNSKPKRSPPCRSEDFSKPRRSPSWSPMSPRMLPAASPDKL